MTFDEILRTEDKPEAEAYLCQAIAELSTCQGYSDKSPWEVFEVVKSHSDIWLSEDNTHAR